MTPIDLVKEIYDRLGSSGDEIVGHGFRAMARTILDEVLEYRVDWIEQQMAHRVIDSNGRACNRTACAGLTPKPIPCGF